MTRAINASPRYCCFDFVPAPCATVAVLVHGDDCSDAGEAHAATHCAAATDFGESTSRIAGLLLEQ